MMNYNGRSVNSDNYNGIDPINPIYSHIGPDMQDDYMDD